MTKIDIERVIQLVSAVITLLLLPFSQMLLNIVNTIHTITKMRKKEETKKDTKRSPRPVSQNRSKRISRRK